MFLHNSNMMVPTKIRWHEGVLIRKSRRYLDFPLSISRKSLQAQVGTRIKGTHMTKEVIIINKMHTISR
jgi:hypothetical protein